jgi:hypothetical protein
VYGGDSPIAVDVSQGRDAPNTSFVLNDPVVPAGVRGVAWPATPARGGRVRAFLDAMLADESRAAVRFTE